MKLEVETLGEPDLVFANGFKSFDHRKGLEEAGPIHLSSSGSNNPIRLGVVGTKESVEGIRSWIERGKNLIIDTEANRFRNRPFPGLSKTLRCEFEIDSKRISYINESRLSLALSAKAPKNFDKVLEIYDEALEAVFCDPMPDVILVYFPSKVAKLRISNSKLTHSERLFLEKMSGEVEGGEGNSDEQLDLFGPTEEEQTDLQELIPQAEELLYRLFHRALKAKWMMRPHGVPIQVFRDQTFVDDIDNQSAATRAWNFFLAVYYKAGGRIPWKPASLNPKTCFIGISFHHLKTRSADLVYASLAQAYSSEIEPFALKGVTIPRGQTMDRQPYLESEQAEELIDKVMLQYEARAGTLPNRVVIHKSSLFTEGEQRGFREHLLDRVAAVDLVWMRPSMFRLVRKGGVEPERSTVCTLGNEKHFLFTTGFVRWWDEYPGPHIPAPLEFGVQGQSDYKQAASEILALSKMNWNSADGISKFPITLKFAAHVGLIMTELAEESNPNSFYRFYM